LRLGHAADPLEESPSVGDALDIRERNRRRVVSRAKYSRKSGTVTAAAFPAETARLTPMLVCTA